MHFGKGAVGFETGARVATLRFADGTTTSAALIVGADGVHSHIREQLLPDCPVVETGTFGIYGKTPVAVVGRPLLPQGLEDSGVLAIGRPGRFFFFTTMTFANAPAGVFARWVPDVDYTILTSIAAATRPARWPASRVTLLGDAVHAMPPTGALGGNTALRDAALLAQRLQQARNGDLLEAVRSYQEEMIAYAFKEVDSSVAMLRRSCAMHPLARFAMLRTVPWLRSLAGQSLVPASPIAA